MSLLKTNKKKETLDKSPDKPRWCKKAVGERRIPLRECVSKWRYFGSAPISVTASNARHSEEPVVEVTRLNLMWIVAGNSLQSPGFLWSLVLLILFSVLIPAEKHETWTCPAEGLDPEPLLGPDPGRKTKPPNDKLRPFGVWWLPARCEQPSVAQVFRYIIIIIVTCGFILDKNRQHENLEVCVCVFIVPVSGPPARGRHVKQVMASVCVKPLVMTAAR